MFLHFAALEREEEEAGEEKSTTHFEEMYLQKSLNLNRIAFSRAYSSIYILRVIYVALSLFIRDRRCCR